MSKNDIEPSGGERIVSTSDLAKKGVAAAGYLAGGALFLVLQIIGGKFRLLGLLLGLVAGGVGVGALLSKDKEDHKPGAFLAVAGALELCFHLVRIPPVQALTGFFLGLGGIACIAMGIVKGIQFLKGLRSRR